MMSASRAGELDLTGGIEQTTPNTGRTYSWGMEYRQSFAEHFAASFIWLNEGHLIDHHRDGQALQVWWRTRPIGPGLVFELGVGPYHYYDTTSAVDIVTPTGIEIGYQNAHGWAVLSSAAIDWYFKSGWFATTRLNDIEPNSGVRSTALTLGVGYLFGDGLGSASHWADISNTPGTPRYEVDGMVGRAVLNSFHSEGALAKALSVRTNINRYFSASLTYTVAQNIPLDWHSGAAAQLWAEAPLTQRLTVGAGIGVFVTGDRSRNAQADAGTGPAGLLAVTAAYALSPRWVVRAIWNRVTTRDDDDSDIGLVGVGYRF